MQSVMVACFRTSIVIGPTTHQSPETYWPMATGLLDRTRVALYCDSANVVARDVDVTGRACPTIQSECDL